jgi:hypothetical protein
MCECFVSSVNKKMQENKNETSGDEGRMGLQEAISII